MIYTGHDLRQCRIHALDGDLGNLHDLYFDNWTWLVRYLVIDTSKWLPGRKVLIAPHAAVPGGVSEGTIAINLTKEQIRHGPGIDEDRPVSRQKESEFALYYGWPVPNAGMMPITAGMPAPPLAETMPLSSPDEGEEDGDPHLRSMRELSGYEVKAVDGKAGDIADLLIDTDQFRVHRLLVDAGDWMHRRKIMLPVDQVRDIEWASRQVHLGATLQDLAREPELA